jgi:hypothetical protein
MVLNRVSAHAWMQLNLRLLWVLAVAFGLLGIVSEFCKELLAVIPIRIDS